MTASDRWIVRPQPNPRALCRLFCAPCAGRGASLYRGWAELLGRDIELCAIQLPGRESRLREPPLTQMARAADDAAEALEPYLDLPFAFFGHSMGAILCFELARRICRRSGMAPLHLFVSGRRAPQRPDLRPALYTLPDARFIIEICRRFNGIPREVLAEPELLNLLLPVLRADVEMLETYEFMPAPPLDCSITAFGGTRDGDVRDEDLEAWREHTKAHFTTMLFPGDHFFIQTATQELLRTICRDLHSRVGFASHAESTDVVRSDSSRAW